MSGGWIRQTFQTRDERDSRFHELKRTYYDVLRGTEDVKQETGEYKLMYYIEFPAFLEGGVENGEVSSPQD